jgi:hypothetical protein
MIIVLGIIADESLVTPEFIAEHVLELEGVVSVDVDSADAPVTEVPC